MTRLFFSFDYKPQSKIWLLKLTSSVSEKKVQNKKYLITDNYFLTNTL